MTAHAPLPPSSMHRMVFCPGSRALTAQYPQSEDSESAREGTAAHWVFERMFAGEPVEEGMVAPNGVIVDEEMLDGARLFVDTVREAVGTDTQVHVERRVAMARTIHADNWGTPDAFAITSGALWLFDYKYGHRFVDAFENWQCIDYVAGICEALRTPPPPSYEVNIVIVQPRHYRSDGFVRRWQTSIEALTPYWQQLSTACHIAMTDTAECMVGDYCGDCSARHVCEALQNTALNSIGRCYESIPLELPTTAAARELRAMQRAAKVLDARITGLSEALLLDLRKGGHNPLYKAERAHGRQRWTRPVSEVVALGTLLGIDLSNMKTITPKQAIQKGVPKDVVDKISDTPIGEWKLVEVDTTAARKVFSS